MVKVPEGSREARMPHFPLFDIPPSRDLAESPADSAGFAETFVVAFVPQGTQAAAIAPSREGARIEASSPMAATRGPVTPRHRKRDLCDIFCLRIVHWNIMSGLVPSGEAFCHRCSGAAFTVLDPVWLPLASRFVNLKFRIQISNLKFQISECQIRNHQSHDLRTI